MAIDGILADLASQGWSRFSNHDSDIEDVITQLGFIILENDVLVQQHTPALVTSSERLPPHTDHHLSHYILWHCLVQDQRGGHSIMIDGLRVFSLMPSDVQEILRTIHLKEHLVFKDDVGYHPLIYETPLGDRIYYSVLFEPTAFWLVNEDLSIKQQEAFDTFNEAVRFAKTIQLKLKPGECLVIDNRRMLHGRTALEDNSNRLLKRYWIGAEKIEKYVEHRG
jgi:gamma-butyrobetaine dioxygenase|tara:strand:+ start:311 stop:979 length:669 start_codon:yes stop_codon:yes gene_type:complete